LLQVQKESRAFTLQKGTGGHYGNEQIWHQLLPARRCVEPHEVIDAKFAAQHVVQNTKFEHARLKRRVAKTRASQTQELQELKSTEQRVSEPNGRAGRWRCVATPGHVLAPTAT